MRYGWLRPAFRLIGRRHNATDVACAFRVGLIVASLATGCTHAEPEAPPREAERYFPGPLYATWWTLTEQCAGVTGALSNVQWYAVTAATIPTPAGERVGVWYPHTNSIALVRQRLHSGRLVRHEMLHALLRTSDHPREYFDSRCAGIVEFGTGFELPPTPFQQQPLPGSAFIPAESLIVAGRVIPLPVTLGFPDSGWATLELTVSNPYAFPIQVRPRLRGDSTAFWRSFSYAITSPDALTTYEGEHFANDTILTFGPREVRRHVAEERLRPAVGMWSGVSYFNNAAAGRFAFSVVPSRQSAASNDSTSSPRSHAGGTPR
jgi:hypothetical protein